MVFCCSRTPFLTAARQSLLRRHQVIVQAASPLLSRVSHHSRASMATTVGTKRKSDALGDEAESDKKPKVNASITSFFGAPKPAAAAAAAVSTAKTGADGPKQTAATSTASAAGKTAGPPAAVPAPVTKFDKDKWVASLGDEERQLLSLEINTLHESWLAHLKDDIRKPSFLALKRFLKKEAESKQKIFPPPEDVYSWSRHTPLDTVKVVILGQDPYHNDGQAHGLCFSVRPPTPAPPSLKNIYKAIVKDYPDFKPPPRNGGLLTPWADRGVLMLNTCLTVRAHQANSHKGKGWEPFTKRVIDLVNARRSRGVVFMAWGAPAKGNVAAVNKERHHVLYSVHPSPLSAERGWYDCHHFKKANDWLKIRYGDDGQIDWSLDVPPQQAGV